MTDWTDLQASGQGTIVLLAEITGLPYVFATHDYTPTDSWYTSEGYLGVKPWLQPAGLEWDEDVDFLSGWLRVSGLTLSITDVAGGMLALIKELEERTSTRVNASIAKADTTIAVLDTSGFTTSGEIWFGLEACHYTATTALSFTGLTRGYFGTASSAHTVDWTTTPYRAAWLTDGARRLEGRPVRIYAAVIGPDGSPGAADVVYRGFVAPGVDVEAAEWTIPVEHISAVFDRRLGQRLPKSRIKTPHFYYSGRAIPSISTIRFLRFNSGASVPDTWDITVNAGTYNSAAALHTELNERIDDALGVPLPVVTTTDGINYTLTIPASASYNFLIYVRRGDPLWALGFDEGTIAQDTNTLLTEDAPNKPAVLVVDMSRLAGSARPAVEVDDATVFTAGLRVQVPGEKFVNVQAASGTTVTLDTTLAEFFHTTHLPPWAVADEDADDAILRHVLTYSGDTLVEGMQRMTGQLAGQTEPDSWLANGLTSADIDWDELTTAIAGVPEVLRYYHDAITESIELKAMMCPRLGLAAIAPRVTADGKLGFARLETPTLRNADSVEVDSSVWSLLEAADIKVRWGAEPLLTQAKIKHGYSYRTDDWPDQPATVNWDDGSAELGKTRSVNYEARGLITSPTWPGAAADAAELESLSAHYITSTIFGVYGRLAPVVDIPCTWLAQQLYCGDVVKTTHPLAPDVSKGALGMTDRLGIVVGRHVDITGGEHMLRVRVPADNNVGALAPGALFDIYVASTAIGTASDVSRYARTGDTDLTYFAACVAADGSCPVAWAQYNTTSPSEGVGTLTAVSASTVSFASDVFSTAFPTNGVWLLFGDWDNASTYAQTGWCYISDTSYGLGAAPDAGYQWGT